MFFWSHVIYQMIGPVWSRAGPGVFWVFVNNFNGENRDDLHRQKLTHCDWSSVLTCSGELHFRPDLGIYDKWVTIRGPWWDLKESPDTLPTDYQGGNLLVAEILELAGQEECLRYLYNLAFWGGCHQAMLSDFWLTWSLSTLSGMDLKYLQHISRSSYLYLQISMVWSAKQ